MPSSILTPYFPVCFKLLLIIPIFVSSCSIAIGAEADPLRTRYSAEEVSNDIFVIHGPNGLPSPENQGFMNNPGFIITNEGVVVIDPGSSVQIGRMVLDQIALQTDKEVIASIATHIHGDHWLGNQAITERFPEAKLYAHADLIDKAKAGEAQNWLDLMMQLTAGATEGTIAVIPDIAVGNGEVLKFGDVEIAIHHSGSAHTDSDIALMVSPNKVMFAGDLVFNRRLGRMDDGTYTGLISTLESLAALTPELVVPGHGQTGKAFILDESLALYQGIYVIVEEKFEEGLPDYEMKPFVVQRLQQFVEWNGFSDSIGRLISLAYLEVEENNF